MLGIFQRRFVVVAVAIILLATPILVSSAHFSSSRSSAQAQAGSLGIVIPLYTDPGSVWNSIIQAKQSYPNVPFIVVINPDNGPGNSKSSSYVTGVEEMQAAGIIVLGYVDTEYTDLSLSTAESQSSSYYSWYRVNGIMFDCMQNTLATESYYTTLNTFVHSLGMSLTMGNPGTTVPASEVGVFNILNIYENPGLPSLSSLSYSGDPTSDFSLIAYGVSFSSSFVDQSLTYVSYIYLTNANGGNPYETLPSYFTTEVAALSSIDSSSTPGNPITSSSMTTQSSTSTTGTVSTSTTNTHTTTSTTKTSTSTSTTSASSTTTHTTTSSSASGTSTLSISSENTLGNPITGYYTELYTSAGKEISNAYTPASYTLDNGVTYQIEADSYGVCTFSHWSGGSLTGSTTDPADISINSATSLIAVYSGSSCGS